MSRGKRSVSANVQEDSEHSAERESTPIYNQLVALYDVRDIISDLL